MNIIWSELAKEDYWNNIDYLLNRWTTKEATHFINQVDDYLKIIAHKPKTFSPTKYKNIHAVPVVSQITLYYRVKANNIELVRFWNNYQDPKKVKL